MADYIVDEVDQLLALVRSEAPAEEAFPAEVITLPDTTEIGSQQ
jgi:hypothetical protein